MKLFGALAALLAVLCGAENRLGAQSQESGDGRQGSPPSTITVPAGTKAELALTAPVWTKSAKAGDPLYMQVDFPVTAGERVAIPPGTFVQGTILSVERPTWRSGRALIQVLFSKIVFANGYVIGLPAGNMGVPGSSPSEPSSGEPPSAVTVTIQVSASNDLLLDNGAQIEMTLATAVNLDVREVTHAIAVSKAPEPGKFKTATRCRPTPGIAGTEGTPDTVIPGSPGTPDTTIPGGPGQPSIVIPGTPATPPTVIPGTPGTPGFPGTVCPPAPMVVSSVPLVMKPVQAEVATPPAHR